MKKLSIFRLKPIILQLSLPTVEAEAIQKIE